MFDVLADAAGELFAGLAYVGGAGLLMVAGLLAGQQGLANLAAGHALMAGWFAYMGLVAVGAAHHLFSSR